MKTIILVILSLIFSISLFAQEKEKLFNIRFGEKDYTIGGYLEVTPKYSTYDSKPAGYVDFKGAFLIDGKWGIGLVASGLLYDKKLNALVQDGTYHIYAGYTGIYVERIFEISDIFRFNISIATGTGEAYYKYDKEYLDNKVWYEEVIDKTTFHVTEPQIEFNAKISSHFAIGLTGSFRFTSPIKLIQTDENILRTLNCGVSFKYGIF